MESREFFDRVAAHPELEWLGAREGETPGGNEVLVRHTRTDVKYAMTVGAVLEHPWEELEAVLTCRREAQIMTHLTRIVGYYSRVQNWNRSKLAELRDRQAGEYSLSEARPAVKVPSTPPLREKLAAVA